MQHFPHKRCRFIEALQVHLCFLFCCYPKLFLNNFTCIKNNCCLFHKRRYKKIFGIYIRFH